VVAGSRVRAIGEQASTPIPAGSDKINGAGRFLVPSPVAIPDTLARVKTLAEAQLQIDDGAPAVSGIPLDTEQFNHSLLEKWRSLQVVFVPRLYELDGADLSRAQRNAGTLARYGVLIGAGSGPFLTKEIRLLADAGLAPTEILAAATKNAARAAKQSEHLGTLAPGMTASAWLLPGNPLEDPTHLDRSKAEHILTAGEWER
jgi:imidazolonepropionase-like amidohydrolase